MPDVDPRLELFAEGLKSYPAAREAVKAFEELVGGLARQVMLGHLEELREASGQPNLSEDELKVVENLVPPPAVGVGGWCRAPETWGIIWGIKWTPPQSSGPTQLRAFAGVRVSAAYKRESVVSNLLSAAQDAGSQAVEIEKASGWGHDVYVSVPMDPNISIDETERLLDQVVATFLGMVKRAGGISALLTNRAGSGS